VIRKIFEPDNLEIICISLSCSCGSRRRGLISGESMTELIQVRSSKTTGLSEK
jgi:hypothetical protein